MTETTKTIEERVAALETKTTTLSTSVSNAITVANRAAGSATTANTTANTAKANAGAAQAAATTASAAAAAARKIAEDAALTAEDAFGETADNLKAIEEDVRPALKNLQNKDAALQTAIDAVPDLTANVTALEMMFTKLQAAVDAIPDASADITALTAKVTALETAVNAIPSVPSEILPIPVGESTSITGSGHNYYVTFSNIVAGTYKLTFTLDAFDKSIIGLPENVDIVPRVEVQDQFDPVDEFMQRNGIYSFGKSGNGNEENSVSIEFKVINGHPLSWPKETDSTVNRRGAGYLDVRPYVTLDPLSSGRISNEGASHLIWTVTLERIS